MSDSILKLMFFFSFPYRYPFRNIIYIRCIRWKKKKKRETRNHLGYRFRWKFGRRGGKSNVYNLWRATVISLSTENRFWTNFRWMYYDKLKLKTSLVHNSEKKKNDNRPCFSDANWKNIGCTQNAKTLNAERDKLLRFAQILRAVF